jgi:hypothetical protein
MLIADPAVSMEMVPPVSMDIADTVAASMAALAFTPSAVAAASMEEADSVAVVSIVEDSGAAVSMAEGSEVASMAAAASTEEADTAKQKLGRKNARSPRAFSFIL